MTCVLPKYHRNVAWKEELKKKVTDFYLSDEASRDTPGKRQFVRIRDPENPEKKMKVQSRILNEYIDVLYEIFIKEHPDVKCSKSLFFAIRPEKVLTSCHLSSYNCLCTTHENVGLLLKSILPYIARKYNSNPDAFYREVTSMENLDAILNECVRPSVKPTDRISVKQWKKKDVPREDDPEKTLKRAVCEPEIMSFGKATEELREQYTKFIKHKEIIYNQYAQIKNLKEKVKVGEPIVYLDFAENWLMKGDARATQDSYWNPAYVTLHPVCVYYRLTEDGPLLHHSFIYISSVTHHNAAFVITLMKSLILKDLKKLLGDDYVIRRINYVSDGPTSQYRNCFIAFHISLHPVLYGFPAMHHLWEKGHGKSVCDGIGGVIKRKLDQGVFQGHCSVTQASDVYDFLLECGGSITPIYITREAFRQAEKDMAVWKKVLTPVPKTYENHAIVSLKKIGWIGYAELSCTCEKCRLFLISQCTRGNKWCRARVLPRKKSGGIMVEHLGENLTACEAQNTTCRYLCCCPVTPLSDMSNKRAAENYRESENRATDAENNLEPVPSYCGMDALPTDTIDQNGMYSFMLTTFKNISNLSTFSH